MMTLGTCSRIFGIVGMLSLVSVVAAAADPSIQPASNTIRVVARATVAAKPDQAELEVGVTTNKKTAAAAVAENDHKMEQVLAVLRKEVGADGEAKTSEVSVRPRFEETRSGLPTPHIVGYVVTNTVQVRITNIKAVGKLLDLAFQSGANTVERVRFTLKDPEAAQNQALHFASAKARARAAAIAEGQGARVGEVVSVSEGERDFSFADFQEGGGYRARANVMATQVEPGSVEVSATVIAIFALKVR